MNRQWLMFTAGLLMVVLVGVAGLGTIRVIALTPTVPPPTIPPTERATLGVGVQSTAEPGVLVTVVQPGSAAEAAGLRPNDVILTLDGQDIGDVEDLLNVLRSKQIGDRVVMGVQRAGQTLTLTAQLTAPIPTATPRPSSTPRPTRTPGPTRVPATLYSFSRLGFSAQTTIVGTLQVIRVTTNSLAARAGLQAGDNIIVVNDVVLTLENVRTVASQLAMVRSGSVTLRYLRGTQGGTAILSLDGSLTPTPFTTQPPAVRTTPFRPTLVFQSRVQLGVVYDVITQEYARANNLAVNYGAYVVQVLPNTPAEAAGLRVGDIILAVNGDIVDAKRPLPFRLAVYAPGDRVQLTVRRGAQTLTITVTLVTPRGISSGAIG
jgi:S1-C subfamily serine protease